MRPMTKRICVLTAASALALWAAGCESADDAGQGSPMADTADASGSGTDVAGGHVDGEGDPGTDATGTEPDVPALQPDVPAIDPDTGGPDPDAAGPEPDVPSTPPDVPVTEPDATEGDPDTSDPTMDAEMPDDTGEADAVGADCVPGTVDCDGEWVVVCEPGGASWMAIVACGDGQQCFEGLHAEL